MGCVVWSGQVAQATGSATGKAIRHIQQMTRSAPSSGVTRAPYT